MNFNEVLAAALAPPAMQSIVFYFALMAVVAVLEIAIPLRARTRWNDAHLAPNLSLTLIYVATNLLLTAALVLLLSWCTTAGFGIFNAWGLTGVAHIVAAVAILDFQAYGVHVAMHEVRGFWRFHRVHHGDPAVDVTTALRQHPGESLIRFVSLAAFAVGIGASVEAFALYRLLSGVQALSEHANVRVPRSLDALLSFVIATPNYHKVHHSRDAAETDTNYANIFSLWDRLFVTVTPSSRGTDVRYGLDDVTDGEQTTLGLITLPFRGRWVLPRDDRRRRAR
jgi:sterol desaturase/sphingolipid hydroxylase (fatty acid hydroxylase superfamily)